MSLIQELRRRNVIRAAGLYLVGAWLVTQVAGTVLPMFGAPDWLPRSIVILLAIGFVPALIFAWVFELTPEGLKRDAEVKPEESIAPQTGRRIDRMIIAVLVLALAYFALDKFVLGPRRAADLAVAPASTGGTAATSNPASAATPDEHSIAVLPFVNMSADPAQEYFSEGIAEELLNQLAQSPDLHVAARTSAFQFKGKNLDIADIARQLRVANVLEGSVRREGARIRVTAQLIAAASGFHLWSQTFERDAADVFKVQDEIAGAIANQLEARLGAHATHASAERSIDPAAYDDYLQGRRHVALRVADNLHEAAEAFTRTIARAPDYAPAYSGRAFAFAIQLGWKPWQTPDEAQAAANADIAQALRLDPDSAEAYMVRAVTLSWRLHCNAALADYEHALKLAPGNVDVMNFAGDFLQTIGALRRAESLKRQAMALDPLAWVHPMNLDQILDGQGRYAEAVAMGERALALGGTEFAVEQLFYSQLHAGDRDGARAGLVKVCAGYGEDNPSCRLDRALLLAVSGGKDDARSVAASAAEQPAPEWGGVAPHVLAAAVFARGLDDYATAAVHVRGSFGAVAWYPTLALLWAQGGAKLPEEMSRDPQWLAAWNDPRAAELMALYRANIAAFRRGE